jgi:predicted NAD/FAD-binding protein
MDPKIDQRMINGKGRMRRYDKILVDTIPQDAKELLKQEPEQKNLH